MQKATSLFFALLFIFSGLSFGQKQGKSIKIDGKSQQYQLAGTKDRKLGQPLIIIESDLGANLEPWRRVINELQENTPVLVYDRAGIGQSEAFDEIPTPANRTKQLKRLLDELKLPPPYILLGDGWGSILIKDFAQTHAEDIDAMIYIDPIDKSSSRESMIEIFDREGLEGEKIATDYFRMRRALYRNVPAEVRAEAEVMLDFLEGKTQNLKLYDFPKIPTVIFVGGKHVGYMENPINPALGLNYQELVNVLQKNRISDITELTLASTNFEMILTSEYAHYLHLQIPEKIGSAIMQAYFGKPAQKIITASERYSSGEFEKYLEGLLSYYPKEKLTEPIINMLGYDQLRRDQPEHGMILFQHNLERFPNSANVYDSVGDCLVSMGKVKDAIPYFEKAVNMGKASKHSDLELFKKNLASAKEEK
jgi:pimeloyl-ACP methyl ester carboxylesterase